MERTFNYLIYCGVIVITLGICRQSKDDMLICTICLLPLSGEYSRDAWHNPFHRYHEDEGIFCHSCSRIISQRITQGGFQYTDGRHLCSLCQLSVVEDDSIIHASYMAVITQFKTVGIDNLPRDIPIELINLIELNKKGQQSHENLKGFTYTNGNHTSQHSYKIFMLFGLPRIEFEAVLAHELLHVWIHQNQISLSLESIEGFCNLGQYLIYQNDQTQFSTIHLEAMDNSQYSIYGVEYRKMKAMLEEKGWNNLISFIMN